MLSDEPKLTLVCHCTDCQKYTGSAFGVFAIIKKTKFALSGELKGYTTKGESGRVNTRYFCGTCGSSIYSELEKAPGIVVISVGTLEGGQSLVPSVHTWVKQKHAWVTIDAAVEQFQEEIP